MIEFLSEEEIIELYEGEEIEDPEEPEIPEEDRPDRIRIERVSTGGCFIKTIK